jgi:hypothetical protein
MTRNKFTVHTPALQYFTFTHDERYQAISSLYCKLNCNIFSCDFLLVIDVGLIRSLVDLYFDGPAPRGRIDPLVEAQEPRYRNPFNKNSFHFCEINLSFTEHALTCEPDHWFIALTKK